MNALELVPTAPYGALVRVSLDLWLLLAAVFVAWLLGLAMGVRR